MKAQPRESVLSSYRTTLNSFLTIVTLIFLVTVQHGFAQTKKETPVAPGYLQRSPPNLRFAPPPKPAVLYLPPAGVPKDGPPAFSIKFREKDETSFREDTNGEPANAKREKQSGKKAEPDIKPETLVRFESVRLTDLVKYFPEGNSAQSTNEPVLFQPPVNHPASVPDASRKQKE